jgi:DNA modification methylase
MNDTIHRVKTGDSRDLGFIPERSVDLVVTSPPYPMIEMWDEPFSGLSEGIAEAMAAGDGEVAFERMHGELDKTWSELFRVLKPGGFACINIGDATRTIGKRFRLYSNHTRIVRHCTRIGFDALPVILWRKQTNAPNKFMGSGMLPAGAYVTLEHEYILIFRKGAKREFVSAEEKELRHRSAIFWEERNQWFSDVWFDLKGASQVLNDTELRKRSAAYPFELAYRLVNMYSVQGDTVLDPFLGTGTTLLAAMASGRNSIGVEIDPAFRCNVIKLACNSGVVLNARVEKRIAGHVAFAKERSQSRKPCKYTNENHGFPVMTNQERRLDISFVRSIDAINDGTVKVTYDRSSSFNRPPADEWMSGKRKDDGRQMWLDI